MNRVHPPEEKRVDALIISSLNQAGKGFISMKKKMLCAIAFMSAGLLCAGCSASGIPGLPSLSKFVYDNADKYTMGNADLEAEGIKSIEIDWVSGEVKVGYHLEDTVVISETANKNLNDNTTMYYYVDGDTLRVKFAKSGKTIPTRLEKELTVWLPEGMELEEVEVDSISADVNVSGLVAERATVDTTSGDIVFGDVTCSGKVEFDTTSGDMTADLGGNLSSFSADSVSGDMEFSLAAVKEVELDSISGRIQLSTETSPDAVSAETTSGDIHLTLPGAGKLTLGSTSGEVKLALQSPPDELSVDTVSGDVLLCLPKDADFTVRLDTVSGSLDSELAMKKKGDDYIFGAGAKRYDVDTTSGDLIIEGK